MTTIYAVTVKRMQVWNLRIKAESREEAMTIGDEFAESCPANDDHGYETDAVLARDQTSEPDNA